MQQDAQRPSAVVAHDRPDAVASTRAVLGRAGFHVVAVTTVAAEVRALVRAHQPDVVVVALPLAGVSGMAAVRALRKEAPHTDVVLQSPFDHLEEAGLDAGARAVVADDAPSDLLAVLRELAAARAVPSARTPEPSADARVTRPLRLVPQARRHEDVGTAGSSTTKPSS